MTNAQRNSKAQHAFMMRAISDQQIGHDPLPHIIYTTKHRPTSTPEIHGGTDDTRPMSAHNMHQSIESLSSLLKSKRNGLCPLDWPPGMGWSIAPRCTRDWWADTSHSPHQNDHRN